MRVFRYLDKDADMAACNADEILDIQAFEPDVDRNQNPNIKSIIHFIKRARFSRENVKSVDHISTLIERWESC